MLSRLVTEEIGAKSKGPRGKVGASLSLAALIFTSSYVSFSTATPSPPWNRAPSAANRLARSPLSPNPARPSAARHRRNRKRSPRRRNRSGPRASFDPDSAITSYKPEPSPALDAARDTAVARRFLQVARFPKATVEKTAIALISPCAPFLTTATLVSAGASAPHQYGFFRQDSFSRTRLGPHLKRILVEIAPHRIPFKDGWKR